MRSDGEVVIDLKLNTKSFEAQIEQTEQELKEWIQIYEDALKNKNMPEEDLIRYRKEIEKATNKLVELKKKQDDLGKNEFGKIGNSITSIIKKITRWGLALFGIRSMYMFVRQAASTLSQYNDKINADLQYIRYAIASVLQPIVERIINLVYKLMAYVAYIAKAWFNIDLFANASAKAFNNANTNASKLKRTLAGFDELNILNENGTTGVLTPSFDLSQFEKIEHPWWVDWIAENKELIESFGITLLAVFGIANISKILGNIGLLFGAAGGQGLVGLLGMLTQIALVGGSIVITGYVVAKFRQEVEELRDMIVEMTDKTAEAQEEFIKNETDINNLLVTGNVNRAAAYKLLQNSKDPLIKLAGLSNELLESAEQTAINIGKQIDKEWELYNTTELEKEEKEAVLKNILNQIQFNKDLIDTLQLENKPYSDIVKLNETLAGYANNIYKDVYNTNEELDALNKQELDNKGLTVELGIDTRRADKDYSNWASRLADKVGQFFADLFSGKIFYKAVPGIGSRAKGGIYYPNYPKLAVGGIVNMPGSGIPYHGATIGERGAEAVVPLTDSQQMEYLGEAIGKYITVNLTNITELDGRTIARKVTEVNNNTDFLMNR